MQKVKTSAQLKKDLDAVYSKYIRLKYADKDGFCTCYTCGKIKHWKEMHCGHFIPRNILITRWDERNTRPQDVGCNIFGNGKVLDFEDHLVKDLGRKEVDKLKASRFTIMKVDTIWYLSEIARYEKLLSTV